MRLTATQIQQLERLRMMIIEVDSNDPMISLQDVQNNIVTLIDILLEK